MFEPASVGDLDGANLHRAWRGRAWFLVARQGVALAHASAAGGAVTDATLIDDA
jgi:hypothetical protein